MTRTDFEEGVFLEGETFARELHQSRFAAFQRRASELGDVELVPILFYMPESGGPCDHVFFQESLRKIEDGLANGGFDGVYIFSHGAGTTTECDDLDGAYMQAVRTSVGPEIPIVALLDLHGNVTAAMVEACDVLIAYRTNPHVDVPERMAECAEHLWRAMTGARPRLAHVKLPMLLPSVCQGTAPGQPYGDLLAFAESLIVDPVMNVSVLSGFAFSDTPQVGMSVLATVDGDLGLAQDIARRVAQRAWDERARYVANLTPLPDAIAAAVASGRAPRACPLILADVADNPGGGGRSNTTALLEGLLVEGAEDVFFGLFHDRDLAEEAHRVGAGGRFTARINRGRADAFARELAWDAQVLCLTQGVLINSRGVGAGATYTLGPSALLQVGGVKLAVTSNRMQIMSTDYLEHFGVDPASPATIVVKSRGHFRAGFGHLVPDERILEVDAPGLTTPNLRTVPWTRVPRPILPLDPGLEWNPGIDAVQ